MTAISRFVALVLVIVLVESSAAQSRSAPDSLRRRVDHLPAKLSGLYRAKEIDLSGSTISMTEALVNISDGLLDDAVALQSFVTGQQAEKVRAEIRRDQEAIARSVDYERNAEGWGGTMTTIEAAAARLRHVENLISFYVTRTFEKDQSLKLESWYAAWREASKRDK